jgi:hypothetical protein
MPRETTAPSQALAAAAQPSAPPAEALEGAVVYAQVVRAPTRLPSASCLSQARSPPVTLTIEACPRVRVRQIPGDEPFQTTDQPFEKAAAAVAHGGGEQLPPMVSPPAAYRERAHSHSSSSDESERLFELSEREEERVAAVAQQPQPYAWQRRRERKPKGHRRSGGTFARWRTDHDPLEDPSPVDRRPSSPHLASLPPAVRSLRSFVARSSSSLAGGSLRPAWCDVQHGESGCSAFVGWGGCG